MSNGIYTEVSQKGGQCAHPFNELSPSACEQPVAVAVALETSGQSQGPCCRRPARREGHPLPRSGEAALITSHAKGHLSPRSLCGPGTGDLKQAFTTPFSPPFDSLFSRRMVVALAELLFFSFLFVCF